MAKRSDEGRVRMDHEVRTVRTIHQDIATLFSRPIEGDR